MNDTAEQVIELISHGREFHLISIYNGEKYSNICNFGKGKLKFNGNRDVGFVFRSSETATCILSVFEAHSQLCICCHVWGTDALLCAHNTQLRVS